MIKLFPHMLLRVCGGSFNELESLTLNETKELLEKIHQLKNEIKSLRTSLSDELFNIIQSKNDDPPVQKKLLNIKRDVFNGKNLSEAKVEFLNTHLNADSKSILDQILSKENEKNNLEVTGETLFKSELTNTRKTLQTLAKGETLQKGLVLSSKSLQERITRYTEKDPAKLKKNDIHTEQSLIKYISRLYAKTSPFSTFTNLGTSSFGETTQTVDIENIDSEIKGHIRLNNMLYNFLKAVLLKYRDVYLNFNIRPNPTVTKTETNFLYLTNSNNVEAFQRIPLNPVLDVFQYLTSQNPNGISFKSLIDEIIKEEYIDAPAEDLEAYCQQLIDYGFLEYNIGISGIDPDWDIKLTETLSPISQSIPLMGDLINVLKEVRELANTYAQASTNERINLLEKAYEIFRAVSMNIHEAAGLEPDERLTMEERREKAKQEQEKKKEEESSEEKKEDEKSEEKEDEPFKHQANTYFSFKPEQMFYEDTTSNLDITFNEKELIHLISSYNNILQEMRLFEGKSDEIMKMTHFFDTQYTNKKQIDLLTFYEDYFREVKKPEAEAEEKAKEEQAKKAQEEAEKKTKKTSEKDEQVREKQEIENTEQKEEPKKFAHELFEAKNNKRKEWYEELTKLVPETKITKDNVSISTSDVARANKEKINGVNNSYGSFLQFYSEDNQLMAVSNGSFSGYGKMFSRFLHILKPEVLNDMREWNSNVLPDAVFAEDCDASVFNANLHPPLLEHEIWMPGGQNSLPGEKQIPVTDIEIVRKEDSVQLVHTPTQKRLYVFDLGFQGHGGRSQLFQLLDKFGNAEYLFANPITRPFSGQPKVEKNEQAPKEWTRPRVTLENQIVIQRKAWIFEQSTLPLKLNHESQWDYYKKLNEWRLQRDIPEEVFIYISDRQNNNSNNDSKAKKKLSRDDYKPQYISFNNPFLVDLFEKSMHKVQQYLQIEEMLPHSKHLMGNQDKKYVTEHVVQWYTEGEEK